MLKLFISPILLSCIAYFLSVWTPVSLVSELLSAKRDIVASIENRVLLPSISKKVVIVTPIIKKINASLVTSVIEHVDYIAQTNTKVPQRVSKLIKVTYIEAEKKTTNRDNYKEIIKSPAAIEKNYQETAVQENSYEVSYDDLKDTELVVQDNIKKISWVKISFPSLNVKKDIFLADNSKPQNTNKKEDRISTIASAQEKSTSENTNSIVSTETLPIPDEAADELVFFDLTEEGKVVIEDQAISKVEMPNESLVEAPRISKVASGPMTRTTTKKLFVPGEKVAKKKYNFDPTAGQAPRVATVDPNNQKKNPSQSLTNMGNEKNKGIDSEIDYSCLDEKTLRRKTFKSEYSVSLTSITLGTEEFEAIHNFDIRFQDDLDDIAQDFGTGEVNLNYKLNSDMNIRRGIVFAPGHYLTAVDFVFEGVSAMYSIPVFEKDKFNKIVEELDVPGLGAQVLVELDDLTEDVELDVDTKYDAKVFLNERLNMVNRSESDYSYVLFVGVDTGNTIINFRNVKGQETSKIVYLAPKEIYYEPNFYAEVVTDTLNVFEEGLRSKCIGLLDMASKDIAPWSYDGKVSKTSLNSHNVGKMLYPLGTRKYFDLKHHENSIFVGKWSESDLIIPSEEYVDSIKRDFEIEEHECTIQVNVNKSIKYLNVNGLGKDGPTNTEVNFLDKNGKFYKDVSGQTNRIFIVGEEQGQVNIKLEYTDGTTQYVQTLCSKGSYLVEQL